MPDPTHLTDRAWLVSGEPDLARARRRLAAAHPSPHLTSYDLSRVEGGYSFAGEDRSAACWGELVRAEVEAAKADPATPARVTLAKLAPRRYLAVVVTRGGADPRAVLSLVLDPDAPEHPGVPEQRATSAIPAVELPAALRGGGRASGSAGTLVRPCAPVTGFAAAAGVSAPAVLAAAVAVLLARYRGTPDVDLVVSAPDPVLVPVRVDERAYAMDLVREVQRALDHATPVPPGLGATVAVSCHDDTEPEAIGSCTVTPVHVSDGRATHELAIALTAAGELRIDHDAGLFDTRAVFLAANRLVAVLADLTADRAVHDVLALTADERDAVAAWSRGQEQAVEDTCLHTLVERHAAATPDAVAVVCGEDRLTYGELNARANRIAHRLRASGIGADDLVAVLADRAAGSIASMLGVLKSGAAYVPVEPSYPAERIRHVLADSGARAVVAHRPFDAPVPVISPDDCAGQPEHDPGVAVDPADLAYLIYTSGSTGVPKGVAVSHRAIVVSTHARGVGGPPPERDLVTMPLCFDGAAGGLYWTLTGGGTVVLPTEVEAHDLLALRALLLRTRVTHVHSVPSHYGLVLQAAGGEGLEQLRLVSVGGEPMPPKLVAWHLFDCPEAVLLNDYGPTECAVWATAHGCGLPDATGAKIPIGGPLPNYRVHVLDGRLRPVPPGLPGEIWIGGPAVARGYHRRPATTAERFLPDPFGAPGDRLYRTGDRGLWSVEGELHITGRVDNQVKLRGFRVELGEIEAAVRRHRSVADCAVTVRTAPNGVDQVLAFVASPDAGLTDGDLRGEVARLLPAYMHPDRFVVLPELPRSPSGKLDAQALRSFELDPVATP
ncbi:amino acid adenylation domain-containing protein [Saccharothrix syringae]|uniref:Amino acid adenylation domain-containing protein n=1 Tax=Saccharothrix syringae TaxID=103733 RepID=A0A5Q0H4K4_SACSY|nr:amino acid adenylation domain-containing protein [Saccharothrix syringae]QFZ21168.1 amino acid adenylation domain-containing protein [Saccharothrix syringae]